MNLPQTCAQYRRLVQMRAAPRDPGTIAADMIRSTEQQAAAERHAHTDARTEQAVAHLVAISGHSAAEVRDVLRYVAAESPQPYQRAPLSLSPSAAFLRNL